MMHFMQDDGQDARPGTAQQGPGIGQIPPKRNDLSVEDKGLTDLSDRLFFPLIFIGLLAGILLV